MNLYVDISEKTLTHISKRCPTALGAYLHCVKEMDEKGQVRFCRGQVEMVFRESWVKFKNQINKLVLAAILKWNNVEEGISVKVIS